MRKKNGYFSSLIRVYSVVIFGYIVINTMLLQVYIFSHIGLDFFVG